MRLLISTSLMLLFLAAFTTPAAAGEPAHEDAMRKHDAIAYELNVSASNDDFECRDL